MYEVYDLAKNHLVCFMERFKYMTIIKSIYCIYTSFVVHFENCFGFFLCSIFLLLRSYYTFYVLLLIFYIDYNKLLCPFYPLPLFTRTIWVFFSFFFSNACYEKSGRIKIWFKQNFNMITANNLCRFTQLLLDI